MYQCPACGNFDCFTEEGVHPILLARGYLKCTKCLRIVIPVATPLKVQNPE